MTTPLSEDEVTELEQLLLYNVDTEDVMTLDMADGSCTPLRSVQ